MDVRFGNAGAVPGCEQDPTAAAFMLHILHRVHEVRNAARAQTAAEYECPRTRKGLASQKAILFLRSAEARTGWCSQIRERWR